MSEQAILDILDKLRNKFYGKYRGSVIDNSDPNSMGRIKAQVPAVLGTQTSGWCMPCVPYAGNDVGIAFIPEVGSGVWIEFEQGDVSYPIWTGCYWRSGELPSEATPTVKTIKTASGHLVTLDDDQSAITIQDPNQNSVTTDSSSGLTVTGGSSTIVVGSSEVNINSGALEVTS